MTHIETFEPRRLMAATGLDPTFGRNGTFTLANVKVRDAVVSFPGGYFVEAASASGTDYLYKLTTAGKIDTAWGDRGRVASPYFDVDTLVYDKRYNLLYAAGVTRRFTNGTDDTAGNTVTLRIERFDGLTGNTDTTFGDSSTGVASFTYGKSNTSITHSIDIGRLLPLPKRQFVVALDHTSYQNSDDYFSDTRQTVDVTLLKYNRNGTRDLSFGRRGIDSVTSGYIHFHEGAVSYDQQFDNASFADLQARADGTIRVITSRDHGTSSTANDDEAYTSETSTFYVRSQVFSAAGVPDATQDRSWRVVKYTTENTAGYETGTYEPMLIRAVGDDGAVAVGSLDYGLYPGDPSYARLTTMTPDARSTVRLPRLDGHAYDTVIPFARGFYAVDHDYILQAVRAIKVKSDFTLPAGSIGETVTPLPNTDTTYTVDIDGRLLVLNGNQIDRIVG